MFFSSVKQASVKLLCRRSRGIAKKHDSRGTIHSADARCEDTKFVLVLVLVKNITIDIKIINTPLSVFHWLCSCADEIKILAKSFRGKDKSDKKLRPSSRHSCGTCNIIKVLENITEHKLSESLGTNFYKLNKCLSNLHSRNFPERDKSGRRGSFFFSLFHHPPSWELYTQH